MAGSSLQRRKIELLLEKVDYLPTLPGVALHVLPLVIADQPSRREIQLCVEVDPALAARALKLAIDLGHPADAMTSTDAVLDAVPLDTLAASLLSIDAVGRDLVGQVELPRLWRHILATAMAAQIIATRLGTIAPETALLAGLLHDIGQVALRVLMPKAYHQVLERLDATGADLLEVERELLGMDHAVLGKRLAEQWGFSDGLQDVIWLHHQAQAPVAGHAAGGPLTELVRLADLLARQHGFSYHASEQIAENPAEVAERLGLSGVQAEQIARQLGPALQINARPAGLETEPSADELRHVLGDANARLGQRYRTIYSLCAAAQAESEHARLLIRLNADLATCHRARDVLETIATTARDALDLRVVVPYTIGRDGDYIEGIRCTAKSDMEEHFLYAAADSLEPPPSHEAGPLPAPAGPVRAERVEGWLFERQGRQLGSGPFYTAPMTVEHTKVGGLVFSLGDPPREMTPREAERIAALANIAAIALKRAQAEADLVRRSEELADVNRQLEAAHQQSLQQRNAASLGRMATGAAHEINNPLAIISGRAQQLATEEDDPTNREMLQTIVQQAARISDVITELQLFAKPPAPAFRSVDLMALARQVAAEFPSQGEPSATSILVEGNDGTPLIHVDPDQVTGALTEIVKNAVEACSQGRDGTVRIVVQPMPTETAVRLVVTDDGPGMDPKVRARAFDPFYSGYDAGRHRGLGLPKAYRAILANGGQMALESIPGHGTTVRVTFPAAEPAPAQSPSEPLQA